MKLPQGDQIQWRKTDKDLDLKNGLKGEVLKIEGDTATVRFKDGRVIDLNMKDQRHWDHGYASTIFSAQGQTYRDAIVLAESWRRNLINQKTFYVALSRAKENAYVYTDDKSKLIRGIEERTGEKTSALEGRRISVEKLFASDGLIKETRLEKATNVVKEAVNKAVEKIRGGPSKEMSL